MATGAQLPASIDERFKQRDAALRVARQKAAARDADGKFATPDEIEALGLNAEQFQELVRIERNRQRSMPLAKSLPEFQATLTEAESVAESFEAEMRERRQLIDASLSASRAAVKSAETARDWLLRHPMPTVGEPRARLAGRIGRIERDLRRPGPKPRHDERGAIIRHNETGEWGIGRATPENRATFARFMERVDADNARCGELRTQLAVLRWKRAALKELVFVADATQADVDAVLARVPTDADLLPFRDAVDVQSDDAGDDDGTDDFT